MKSQPSERVAIADESRDDEPDDAGPSAPTTATKPHSKRLVRWGVGLILFSGVLFLFVPLVPFLPLGTGAKFVLAGVIYAFVQVTWWGGAALAGPETTRQISSWFKRRFFRRRKTL